MSSTFKSKYCHLVLKMLNTEFITKIFIRPPFLKVSSTFIARIIKYNLNDNFYVNKYATYCLNISTTVSSAAFPVTND